MAYTNIQNYLNLFFDKVANCSSSDRIQTDMRHYIVIKLEANHLRTR